MNIQDGMKAKNMLLQLIEHGDSDTLQDYLSKIATIEYELRTRVNNLEEDKAKGHVAMGELQQINESQLQEINEKNIKIKQLEQTTKDIQDFHNRLNHVNNEYDDKRIMQSFELALQEYDIGMVEVLIRTQTSSRMYKKVFEHVLREYEVGVVATLIKAGLPESVYKDKQYREIAENSPVDAYKKLCLLEDGLASIDNTNHVGELVFGARTEFKKMLEKRREKKTMAVEAETEEKQRPSVLSMFLGEKKSTEKQKLSISNILFGKKKSD